jgi:branched-chain amino acid transport system substrate-binding protein
MCGLIALIMLACACPAFGEQGKRMALLIGNEAYRYERPLKNPVNDAVLLGRIFRDDLNFDEVKVLTNLDVNAMDRAIKDFVNRAHGADAVVFYYSGHGTKSPDRRNYLLPVDARTGFDDSPELVRQAVSAEDIRDRLKTVGARLALLVLDACRDGPGRGKSGTKGLARMGGANQVLVAYATEEDRVAADGPGANSPYAEALAQALRRSDMPLLAQLDWVSDEVRRRFPQQEPTREGNLRVDAYLARRVAAIVASPTGNPQPPAPIASAAANVVATASPAISAQTGAPIRIAYIDPLSGGGATVGEHGLKHLQFLVDEVNANGGVLGGQKLEVVAYDNKGSPRESLVQVQKAIDAGVRYITQGNGSGTALAISEFVNKYNERNPGKEVLYFNYAAVDPALTEDKCNYWHFRWDANSDIKMAALTNFMRDKKDIKKVYIIGQDYSFGHSVRTAAVAMLKAKRPDIQIVGNELHPLLKITDFAPYIAKIKASGADSVITGNWGNDIALLLKAAAADAGLKVDWYTYYAGGPGAPTAIKQFGLDHQVFQISVWHANVPSRKMETFTESFLKKYGGPSKQGWWYLSMKNEVEMFAEALNKAKSADPKNVAAVLSSMKYNNSLGAEVFFRSTDHSLFQDMYISSFGSGTKHDEEQTGWGWKTVGVVKAQDTVTPTSCKMSIPAG